MQHQQQRVSVQPYTMSCPADLTETWEIYGRGWFPGTGTSGKIKTRWASLIGFSHIPWLSLALVKFSQLVCPQQQRRFQYTETVKHSLCREKATEMNAIPFLKKVLIFQGQSSPCHTFRNTGVQERSIDSGGWMRINWAPTICFAKVHSNYPA